MSKIGSRIGLFRSSDSCEAIPSLNLVLAPHGEGSQNEDKLVSDLNPQRNGITVTLHVCEISVSIGQPKVTVPEFSFFLEITVVLYTEVL